jgi:hypothetical protein
MFMAIILTITGTWMTGENMEKCLIYKKIVAINMIYGILQISKK